MKNIIYLSIRFSFFCSVIFSQWSSNPSAPQLIGSGIQTQAASTQDGGLYIAWLSDGNYHVYLQYFNHLGEPQLDDGGMVVSNNQNASWIAVYHLNLTVDHDGNAIISTVDQRTASTWEVYAYKVGPDGMMYWGLDGLSLTSSGLNNMSPRLAVSNNNSVIVTWTHNDNSVLFQHISPDGSLLWDDGIHITDNNATLISPNPVFTSDNNVLIQWIRQTGPFWAASSQLYLQKYDYDGNELWSEPVIAAGPVVFPTGNWSQQSIPDANNGGFSGWTEMSGNVQNAVVQHIDINGELLWGGGVDLSDNSSHFRISPKLAIAENNQDLIIVWNESNSSQSQRGAYAQRLDSGGNKLWGANGTPVIELNGDYDYLDLSIHSFGEDIISSYIEQTATMSGDIYATRIDQDGSHVWTNNRIAITSSGISKSDLMTVAGPSCVFILWTENGSVYGHCLRTDGTFGAPTVDYSGPIWYVAPTGSDNTGDGSSDSPFATIQKGINMSDDGDTVLVSEGIYSENLIWPMVNGITLVGSGSDDCFITGDLLEPVILFSDGLGGIIDTTTSIKGFTIQEGNKGISCFSSSPKITDCIIKDNASDSRGGGISLQDSSNIILRDVLLIGNSSYWQGQGGGPGGNINGQGGGIVISNSAPLLENVELENNSAGISGGGLQVIFGAPRLINCVIKNNSSIQRGGGVSVSGISDVEMIGTVIRDNNGGYRGGGISLITPAGGIHNKLTLSNVRIINNFAEVGAGMYVSDDSAEVNMTDVSIKQNTAGFQGGGIALERGDINFSSTDRCNIYSNIIDHNRGYGKDLLVYDDIIMDVVVDTFTVYTSSDYYSNPVANFTFDILNAVNGDLINGDVFVSVNGDDSNDGLSFDTPFKTIQYALGKIYADSINTNTIHLGPGVYSPSTNNEQYPISWSSFVNLSGSGENETILKADELFKRMFIFFELSNIKFDSLSIQTSSGMEIYHSSLIINDVTFENNFANNGGAVDCQYYAMPVFNNVTFKNNFAQIVPNTSPQGPSGAGGAVIISSGDAYPVFNYCTFIGNNAESSGGAIENMHAQADFNFCLFMDNMSTERGASISGPGNILVQNTTFYNNQSTDLEGTNISIENGSGVINSSIMWNNHPTELYEGSNIGITFSNIDGGYEGEGNIELDPLFCDTENMNFNLQENSPCIGTGQDGANIGAFEVGCSDELSVDSNLNPLGFSLKQNYPNPFNPTTNINIDIKNTSFVKLNIYDIRGRYIKLFINENLRQGRYSFLWDATDNAGQQVPAGMYICVLEADGIRLSKKMLLLK